MKSSSLTAYLGVPVLVQLKNFPIVGVAVRFREKLTYSDEREIAQWIPEPVMDKTPQGVVPSGTQLIQYAVLSEVDGSESHLEMTWFSRPPDPRDPNDLHKKSVVATLIHMDDIMCVTRVVSVDEASPILLASS